MAKSRFKSKYTDRAISDSQYLAELMCERIARKSGETLEQKFWNSPKWKKEFGNQVTKVAELLKTYNVGMIIEALNNYGARNVYSYGLKNVLLPILENIKKKSELIQAEPTKTIEASDVLERPRNVSPTKKNLFKDLQ